MQSKNARKTEKTPAFTARAMSKTPERLTAASREPFGKGKVGKKNDMSENQSVMPRGGTGEENTICVSVLPNCCKRPINASSSCVDG